MTLKDDITPHTYFYISIIMIKTAITGGTSPEAGEILRILVNHPDVEIREILSDTRQGLPVQDVHYGLIGEIGIRFSDRLHPEDLDAIFICTTEDSEAKTGHEASVDALLENPDSYPELRIIDLTRSPQSLNNNFLFGLSEIYRKPLVRGARRAYLPYPEESASLIALFPLARRLLLTGDIEITLLAPPGRIDPSRLEMTAAGVTSHLRGVQMSYNGNVRFTLKEDDTAEALRIKISMPVALDYPHILEAYEEAYDDHNFTFITRRPASDYEVTGTNKCIISLQKQADDNLEIDAVIDGAMRGGACEAVHIFNLLFGLHERTGLALKANGPR